jgi:hypothetical protein
MNVVLNKNAAYQFVDWLNTLPAVVAAGESYVVDPGGVKYLRVVSSKFRSVSLFIEVATGNILKAESWKKPAVGARGNIADRENVEKRHDVYGGWLYAGR